jgi:hypothetical protein
MKMKTSLPTKQHMAMRDDLIAVIRKYGADMDAAAILAVASYTVGQIIALQDQRTMTPAMAMEVVAANIEAGNEHAQAEVKSAGGVVM